MALGNLTFLCFNFMFLGAIGLILIWIVMQVQVRHYRQPRIYSEPNMSQKDGYSKA